MTVTEDHTGKELRAVVDPYTDRRGPGKSATSMNRAMAVTADPIPNAPPRFSGGGPNRIAEGGNARNVGDPMRATDRDNDTLTFGIQTSQYSGHFEIHASTGQIRLTQALDFETITGLVLLTITLHDGKGVDQDNMVIADDSVDVTTILAITVDDVEEEGVVTLSSTEPEVGTPLTATLEDGDGGVTGSDVAVVAVGERAEPGGPPSRERRRATTRPSTRTGTSSCGRGSNTRTVAGPARARRRSRRAAHRARTGGRRSRRRRAAQRTVEENTRAGESVGDPVAAEDPDDDRLVRTR